jgi:hypothetical protein
MLTLNEDGYITNYLVCGPKVTPFVDSTVDRDQLHYEKYLRSIVAARGRRFPDAPIRLGESGPTGMPWKYYYSFGNCFLDLSDFYSVLEKVEIDAAVCLRARSPSKVRAVVWSYSAVDVWCNGESVCSIGSPVYKPIVRSETTLSLREGENLLYASLQNLGVRDTRNVFGIQILDGRDGIEVSLPDMARAAPFVVREKWLSGIRLEGNTLRFPAPAPEGTSLGYDSRSPDFADVPARIDWRDVSGLSEAAIPGDQPFLAVSCAIGCEKMTRRLEIAGNAAPKYSRGLSAGQNAQRIYASIADVASLSRGDKFGFAIANILARKAVRRERPDDREGLMTSLRQIEDRYDCSDFLVSGIIRYLRNYPVDAETQARVDEVLLNYRYWMDQEGSDAMCFWSENHSLFFYSCAMLVGSMYPERRFVRANMTGRELSAFGRRLVVEWLDDVERCGFEEFLSAVYMCLTFVALLNVIDYGDAEVSAKARRVTDLMMRMLAMHTFRGSVIAPMGRVYRDVIYPFDQGVQALMNLANPDVPYSYGEGWLSYFATSGYSFPDDLVSLMNGEIRTEYRTGNALIRLEKTKTYCLASVQSPRTDAGFVRWDNLTLGESGSRATHSYTKSMNERFHGTTCFEPGVYGYQQHLWSAALSNEAIVFVNHPGGSSDSSSLRPGYWYGNGVMPAVRQESGCIGAIYVIPEAHPIHFTHVYWNEKKLGRTVKDGGWLFASRDGGYLGLWCSVPLVPHDDQLLGCEYRARADTAAYFCVCSSVDAFPSLEAFIADCKAVPPVFDSGKQVLERGTTFSLAYRACADKTQYI